MTPAERGQAKIADQTYRRIRAVCVGVPSLDLDEYAARIALNVHRARVLSHVNASGPDGASRLETDALGRAQEGTDPT